MTRVENARERLVIIGSSGHAKVVIDVAERQARYEIAGLIDRFRTVGETTLGYEVLGGEDDLPALVEAHDISACFVAIGDNHVRQLVAQRVRELLPEIPLAILVHPSACVGRDVELGEGTVLMAGSVANPSVRVGRCCIVNTAASLDHDVRLGDFASVAPGARLGGNVRIGESAAIGIGASVVHGRVIGPHAVIGAGSTVLRDIEGYRVAYGTPARVIRERVAGEKYL